MGLEITEVQTPSTPAAPAVTTLATPATPAVPTLGSPEYSSYMAEIGRKARGEVVTPTPENTQAKSPLEGVPEKFVKDGAVNVDALAKSFAALGGDFTKVLKGGAVDVEALTAEYTALEKSHSSGTKTETPPADTPKEADSEVKTYEGYFKQIQENGELDAKDYKTLTEKFPKYLVDSYLEMAKGYSDVMTTKAQSDVAEVLASVGGQTAFDAMSAWARASLSVGERTAFNSVVNNPQSSKEAISLTMLGLKARYEASVGRAPSLVHGQGGGSGSGDTYGSKAEMHRDQADPRYKSDSVFRQSVYSKLSRTHQTNPGFGSS